MFPAPGSPKPSGVAVPCNVRFTLPGMPLERPCSVADPAPATAPVPERSWHLINVTNPVPD